MQKKDNKKYGPKPEKKKKNSKIDRHTQSSAALRESEIETAGQNGFTIVIAAAAAAAELATTITSFIADDD